MCATLDLTGSSAVAADEGAGPRRAIVEMAYPSRFEILGFGPFSPCVSPS